MSVKRRGWRWPVRSSIDRDDVKRGADWRLIVQPGRCPLSVSSCSLLQCAAGTHTHTHTHRERDCVDD